MTARTAGRPRTPGTLYRLALESAPGGTRLHAVAEDGIALLKISVTIGGRLDVPAAPVAAQDAERQFDYLNTFVGLDNPTSSQITRDTLGWTPTRPGLISDLEKDRDLAAKVDQTSAA